MLVSHLKQQLDIDVLPAYSLADASNGEIVDYILDKNIACIVLTSNRDDDTLQSIMNKDVIDIAAY